MLSNNSTIKTLHAHWSCTEGVSASAMLAACLTAKNEAQRIDEIQAFVQATTQFSKGTGRQIISSCDLRISIKDEAVHIQILGAFSEALEWSWSMVLELFASQRQQENLLSSWVLATCRAVLSELINAKREIGIQETLSSEQDVVMFLIKIAGTLHCLDCLGVRSASYSSLPFATSRDKLTQQLLIGMNVSLTLLSNSNNNNSSVMDATSLALLRVLSANAQAETETTPPRQMKLHATGRGTAPPVTENSPTVDLLIGECCSVEEKAPVASSTVAPLSFTNQESSNLWTTSRMTLLEANIDDMTAEHLAFCVDQLLVAGAADAWLTPIVMKKGRAAHTLHCLCQTDQTHMLLPVIFRNSTTLGVRTQSVDRVALRRTMLTVQTEWKNTTRLGLVDVKIGYLGEEVVSVKAEFDHCKEICLEVAVPIQTVSDQAVCKARLLL